jgi:PEP-CTERM motif
MRKLLMTLMLTLIAGVSNASVIQWTDWTGANAESAEGTIGGVGVFFGGTIQFAQLAAGEMFGTGADANTDYWIEGTPPAYTGNATVDNRPPAYELVALNTTSSNVVVFEHPVTNPIMAILSMGQVGVPVSYDFDTPFVVLGEGRGYWGDGTYSVLPGDILVGNELHGVIQFQGTVSQISWSSSAENWHGFTFGLEQPSPSPEPGTLGLLLAGLVGLGSFRRRR